MAQHKKVETYYEGNKKVVKETFYVLQKDQDILDSLYQSFYENGRIKSTGNYLRNKPSGKWSYFYENGNLHMEGELKEGEHIGKWTYFYENGKKSMEGEINKGYREGEWSYFYENGNVKSSGLYKKNNKEGIWKYYYEDGVAKAQGLYEADNGKYTEYYHTGEVKSQGEIQDGKSNGHWKYYFENGKIKAEGYEKKGVKEGLWKYYHENGNVKSEGIFVNGQAEGKWKYYYDNGSLSAEGEEKEGSKNGYWKLYYIDGTIKGEGTFVKGEGAYKEYYESGKLKADGFLKNDKNHGKWKYFYENGFLEGECEFVDGEGFYSGYYENGNYKMQGKLKDGNKVGIWTLYNEDGSLAGYYKTYYENDVPVFKEIEKDTVKQDSDIKKPYIKTPRRKSRYFTKKINEFKTFIVSTGPLGYLEGQFPISAEYYLQERLGFELNYTFYRSPTFRSWKNMPIQQLFYQGFSVHYRQKFYQRDKPHGMYYFAPEIRFGNFNYGSRLVDSTVSVDEPILVSLLDQRVELSLIVGNRIMGGSHKSGFTIDVFGGIGVGYRNLISNWEEGKYINEKPFDKVSKRTITIPVRFGINVGYALKHTSFRNSPPYMKNRRQE